MDNQFVMKGLFGKAGTISMDEPSQNATSYSAYYQHPPRILVVDDDPDQTALLCVILAEGGLDAISAGTASEALALCNEGSFDLCVVDGRLPDSPGHRLIGEIKIIQPATPCILLTGYPESYGADLAVNSGAEGFLVKPANPEFLLSLIEGLLFRRLLVQERERFEGVLQTLRTFRHEVCNPLQGLLGSIDLLLRRAPSDPAVARYAANIRVSAERIMDLLDRLDRLKFLATRDSPVGTMLDIAPEQMMNR
jgi:DNA-binding response OmpR family regulator